MTVDAQLCPTPLWPAGHLPLKGGDQQFLSPLFSFDVDKCLEALARLISPLEGEMAGRPEGGNIKRRATDLRDHISL